MGRAKGFSRRLLVVMELFHIPVQKVGLVKAAACHRMEPKDFCQNLLVPGHHTDRDDLMVEGRCPTQAAVDLGLASILQSSPAPTAIGPIGMPPLP